MSRFNFDELTERHNTASLKWDTNPSDDIIPLWVADMDFRTAPAIVEALRKRVDSGIFGYVDVPDRYYTALCQWFSHRHNWQINRDNVIYTSGVVPAISAIIKALTSPGDGVILQTPAYNCFFSSIRNNGCRHIDNPLELTYGDVGFTASINFRHLEKLAADPSNKLLLLCNPHNPTGRVWTPDELCRISEICRRHNLTVISDEIHCELTHPGYNYTPFATIHPQAIICCSPSKAFNTAGLQIANIVCPSQTLKEKIDRAINDNEVCDVNPFGVTGLIAAYTHGEGWLEELNEFLYNNYRFLRYFINHNFPDWKICNSQSTYLAWIDISATGLSGNEMEALMLEKAKVRISSGEIYGAPSFIRINYACPRQRLETALQRMNEA